MRTTEERIAALLLAFICLAGAVFLLVVRSPSKTSSSASGASALSSQPVRVEQPRVFARTSGDNLDWF